MYCIYYEGNVLKLVKELQAELFAICCEAKLNYKNSKNFSIFNF